MTEREPNLAKKAVNLIRDQGVLALASRLPAFVEEQWYRQRRKYQKIEYQRRQQTEWPADRPLVSVIIPCYNYGAFICEAIKSVLEQTFQRLEILVIDDGSTEDLTKRVLRELEFAKTRVIHQTNQGLAETRNNGVKMAAGKYVCFLDADDLMAPTYLEKTLHLLESDESLGSCYSWVQCFGDSSSVWKTEDLDPYFLKKRNTASSHSVIRKEAWEKVRDANGAGFLSKYNGYFEDWVFWIDMLECGYRGVVIKEPLILYRIHKNSLGATHKPGFDRMLQTLHEDRKDFFQDRSAAKRLEKYLSRRILVENRLVNLASSFEASK